MFSAEEFSHTKRMWSSVRRDIETAEEFWSVVQIHTIQWILVDRYTSALFLTHIWLWKNPLRKCLQDQVHMWYESEMLKTIKKSWQKSKRAVVFESHDAHKQIWWRNNTSVWLPEIRNYPRYERQRSEVDHEGLFHIGCVLLCVNVTLVGAASSLAIQERKHFAWNRSDTSTLQKSSGSCFGWNKLDPFFGIGVGTSGIRLQSLFWLVCGQNKVAVF